MRFAEDVEFSEIRGYPSCVEWMCETTDWVQGQDRQRESQARPEEKRTRCRSAQQLQHRFLQGYITWGSKAEFLVKANHQHLLGYIGNTPKRRDERLRSCDAPAPVVGPVLFRELTSKTIFNFSFIALRMSISAEHRPYFFSCSFTLSTARSYPNGTTLLNPYFCRVMVWVDISSSLGQVLS